MKFRFDSLVIRANDRMEIFVIGRQERDSHVEDCKASRHSNRFKSTFISSYLCLGPYCKCKGFLWWSSSEIFQSPISFDRHYSNRAFQSAALSSWAAKSERGSPSPRFFVQSCTLDPSKGLQGPG